MNEVEEILQKIIQIRDDGACETRVADYLIRLLQIHDIKTRVIRFSGNCSGFIAEIGNNRGPVLAFVGHEDTTLLDNSTEQATVPANDSKIDRKIYGQEVAGLEVSLAAAVFALIELKEKKVPLKGKFRVYGTIGNENSTVGIRKMIAAGLASDLDALVVSEPSGMKIQTLAKIAPKLEKLGIISKNDAVELLKRNQIVEQHFLESARRGALSYDVISQGKAAQSSSCVEANAINSLLAFIQEQNTYFENLSNQESLILGPTTPVITKISGSKQLRTMPEKAKLSVFVRTIPEISNEQLIKQLEQIIKGINLKFSAKLSLKINFKHEPLILSPDSRISQITRKVSEQQLHQKLTFIGTANGKNASQFVRTNPRLDVLVIGPGNASYQVNQYVNSKVFRNFIKIYEEVTTEYLQ